MSKLKTLFITLGTIGACANANAALETDFSRCAESALASKQLKAKSIRVDISPKDAETMDHNPSYLSREYYMEMKLSGKSSGESLGRVRCRIDQTGNIISTSFES